MISHDFEALTPTLFLSRAAAVGTDRLAVVDGEFRLTYAEFYDRCRRQAGALRRRGVRPGDRVAVLSINGHLLLEAHYTVPFAGAVLVALNIRLAPAELAYIIDHAGCRFLLHDETLEDLAKQVCHLAQDPPPLLAESDLDHDLDRADPVAFPVADERSLLALNYTSGTTGQPKGVMYHHRGAYLQSLAMALHFQLGLSTRYLWTLPMFHCNGWCFTWAVTAACGVHVCLPRPEGDEIARLLREAGITHFCAAPTLLTTIEDRLDAGDLAGRRVTVGVGGAPPPPSLLRRCAERGLDVHHLYGLTETFGPIIACEWRPEWDMLSLEERVEKGARQGIPNAVSSPVRVVDGAGDDVPMDGATIGHVLLRGNNVMRGYYLDDETTVAATAGGWFHTGDLGVLHPDGYLELRDRLKDMIVSGGENISSVELEGVLTNHPAVLEAAVVGVPDARWGERPVAFVTLRPGLAASEDQLRAYVRTHLAGFKTPDRVLFGDLPKTATGKIQKFRLREAARKTRRT